MVTIILPISRTEYLRPVFDCLNSLDRPNDTELLIIMDGDKKLRTAIDRKLDYSHYKKTILIRFGEEPAEDIASRRLRIAEIHNKARHYVNPKSAYVFLIEDDTTYPPDTLTKLEKVFKENPNTVFAEGIQLGRWNTPYLGAWKADDIYNPNEILSILPSHGIQSIDAGGFYCALVDADLYKLHHFEPYDKQGNNGLSCDVNFGLYVRQMGYDCYAHHGIQCDHIGDKGSVNLGNTMPRQVLFTKRKDVWTAETL